jgi:outer membrane protein OmpA-like peptidoglycan-associated protein
MKVRAIRGLGILALCAGLTALGYSPAQAQYGSDEATGLSYGVRGGLIFPLTELDGSAGPAASAYARYGLIPKLQLEMSGGYARLKTEDNFNIAEQRYSLAVTEDFATDMGIIDGRVVFSPISHEKWNPFIYGGFGGIRYDFDPDTARRGNLGATGWFGYIPLGIGTQVRLGDRMALEFSLNYAYTFTNKLDENFYDRVADPNNPGEVLPAFVPATGQTIAANVKEHDSDDAFWGLSIGLVLGDIGYKPAIQERATYRPTPMPAPVVESLPELEPEPEPQPLPDLPTLDRDRVFFASNLDAPLTEDSMERLDDVARVMQENYRLLLDLHGYADSTGPRSYNLKLSQCRAEVVKAYLVDKGVEAWRLSIKAFGEANPVSGNDSEEGRNMNRRVELVPLW